MYNKNNRRIEESWIVGQNYTDKIKTDNISNRKTDSSNMVWLNI